MKTWVDLEKTVFDFSTTVKKNEETCTVWDASGKLIRVADFATVLVGWGQVTDERWRESILSMLALEVRQAPIFTAPEGWRMAHILKALGSFASVGDAKRNGWDKEVPEGVTDHICRIRKVKGAVLTFRPPAAILTPGSWEGCFDEDAG